MQMPTPLARAIPPGSRSFDYRTMRLTVGAIALTLPVTVLLWADPSAATPLPSISHAYITPARDIFVGLLFFVGAFLWGYRGKFIYEKLMSSVASFATFVTALVPTTCDVPIPSTTCAMQPAINASTVHNIAAACLFLVLTVFCFLFAFRANKKEGRAHLRKWIYLGCGLTMVIALLAIAAHLLGLLAHPRTVFWAEAIALFAFGVSWLTAAKWFNVLTEPYERQARANPQ